MESHIFKRVNILTGWLMFAISATVYLLTVEPTVSFWDCGEFILSAWKMQVGHPPGAPFFLIVARVFTLFAFGDQSKAALMVNIMSALASAFTIMFLYWSVVHLVRRVSTSAGNNDNGSFIPAMAAGVVAALAYAFSDTFWFSAVEGEVYATSSLFTAVVFWAILKWENETDPSRSGRWIILIAYLMGLSTGVHLLNLLVIPAIVLVYYFKHNQPTARGILINLLLSAAIIGFLVFIFLPYTVKVAGWFELLFVNGMGLPYNTGLYFYLIVLVGLLVFGIRYSLKKRKVILNWVVTIFAVILLGYSSYAMIMIRANAEPPMNQNNPSDLFSMIYYVNREQYGSVPLFKGEYYSAPVVSVKKKTAGYIRDNGKYTGYSRNEYEFDKRFTTFFPRMYSSDPRHIREYEYWADIKGERVVINTSGQQREYILPSFGENLKFFFQYQVGFMYWRYFMWNFAGRQNDIQGNGNVIHGNWVSGIGAIDSSRLGPQEKLPQELRDNPANNRYYFLPLLLGLMGMVWHYRKGRNGFMVVTLLFIMTGLAIIVYLNQNPLQPRERDYAYSGSFYAFSIWVGMGLLFLYDLFRRFAGKGISLASALLISLMAAPVLLASENLDDHNRSGRYTARDIGANYLMSCDTNAILFTYGDNDSFPVWYAQDVEGIRTDVRVANLSYISAGWYIDMLRKKAYESDPLPFSLGSEKYRPGVREQLPVIDRMERPFDIRELVRFAGLDERQALIDVSGRGDFYNYIPANKFLIPVDSATVIDNGTVKEYQTDRMVDEIIWEFPKQELYKNDLAVMDLIATGEWSRPIYYATTVPPDNYSGLDRFFQMEGLAYRLVPLDTTGTRTMDGGFIDTRTMYDNVMNKFTWGNAADPGVYLDEVNRRMFSNFRRMFGVLAYSLAMEGDTVRSAEVVARAEEVIPSEKLPHDYYSVNLVDAMVASGDIEGAKVLAIKIASRAEEYLEFVTSLDMPRRYDMDYTIALNMQSLISLYNLAVTKTFSELEEAIGVNIDRYYNELYGRSGSIRPN
ncbi:MAG: DUF2723 domain-containing protein [Bacteroidales bacterium]|nr:DUF2723 domain-containing protein [Bacteroidales bacterium]